MATPESIGHAIDEKEYVIEDYTPVNPNPFLKHKAKARAETKAEELTRKDLVDSTRIRQPLDGKHLWKDLPSFRHSEEPTRDLPQEEPAEEPEWARRRP